VEIDGRAIIAPSYSEELRAFFLEFLTISPASLSTLVLELQTMARRRPSISRIKQIITAINAMDPKSGDLDPLLTSEVLPIREFDGSDSMTVLRSPQASFAIIDRNNIAKIFERERDSAFLDFTLEEVLSLKPFLRALNLENKFVSLLCDERTVCRDEGLIDNSLTVRFRERAHGLLR
jgi:hypothetical protein